MKFSWIRLYAASLAISLCASCSAPNQNKQADSGWTNLFNGEDLQGWQQLGGSATYKVENNSIVGTTIANSPNSFLATNALYRNYILEFEFQLDPAINSGVQFRSISDPAIKNGRVHGYQFELDPSARAWTAGIYDESRRGWIYPLKLNPSAQHALQGNTWYQARIECEGPEVRTFLNGQAMAHIIDAENIPQQGFIALQVHSINSETLAGKHIRWRNIRITEDVSRHKINNAKAIPIERLTKAK